MLQRFLWKVDELFMGILEMRDQEDVRDIRSLIEECKRLHPLALQSPLLQGDEVQDLRMEVLTLGRRIESAERHFEADPQEAAGFLKLSVDLAFLAKADAVEPYYW